MTGRADVVVIGGGVIGCAIAWALVRRGITDVVVLERELDVGEGASKANSAIVHTGFDATPGTSEATMLRRAAAMWPEVIDELGVPFLEVGAVMLARSLAERVHLAEVIRPVATGLGVATELLGRDDLRAVAPYVTDDAVGGLAIPGESIIDPFWLTRAYAEAAITGGAAVERGAEVTSLDVAAGEVRVGLRDGRSWVARQAIDAAGLQADDVARLAGDDEVVITARRGQFLVTEEAFGVDRIVLPVPGPMGKGMLITPIIFGGALLGPTAVDVADKDDRGSRPDEAARILAATATLVPAMADAIAVRSFVGLRPVSSTGEYIVGPSRVGDRLWLACGIRSTGISASPAVAEQVAGEVARVRGWSVRARPAATRPPEIVLPDGPSEVVCVCRGVTRGEVEAACRRPLAPLTLDGVKRRGGAMFGDCQGNLCSVEAARIVASERGVDVVDIEKGRNGSWLFAGRVSADGPGAAFAGGEPAPAPDDRVTADVVVVGVGHAGRAAIERVAAAGLWAIGVDRGEGWTVVGLMPDAGTWQVEVQGRDRELRLRGRSVLLATGGYVEPREHRATAGPRPAGVITADFVEAASRSGLAVGRRAVVVGEGRLARDVTDSLRAAGTEVVARLDRAPDEIRGDARLDGVRVNGAWLDADTVVLADRTLPQAFLLRGLGLVDGRPGSAAPADAEGRLPLPGLWAAGCCVHADPAHERCAADARGVADRIAGSLAGPL